MTLKDKAKKTLQKSYLRFDHTKARRNLIIDIALNKK
jgi:hypothetical protein